MAAPALMKDREIIDPDFYSEYGYPHEAWAELRRESPVFYWDRNPEMPFWAITKHADITQIGKMPEKFTNHPDLVIRTDPEPEGERFEPPPTIIQMDPPMHGKYRKIVAKRFTPNALKKIHADLDNVAAEIVDSLLAEGDEGECDFVEKVAAPLPIAVISWLLGVPKSDWPLLFDWTNRTLGAGDPEYQEEGAVPGETARNAMIELFTYFAKMVEDRKKNPTDDLVSLFAHAEVDGKPMDQMDILSYCMIIVVAGNETTRNATSGGMAALIEHPDQLRRVQEDPSLLGSCIEEILRWTSPIIHFARTASEDFELRGKTIRAGEKVALFYPSANRDEEVFENPYSFDVGRNPNRHVAFGIGEHFCAGAHVARIELNYAFRSLIPRIAEVEYNGEIDRLRSSLVGGVKRLPIRYKLNPA
jgi:cytochrome P450